MPKLILMDAAGAVRQIALEQPSTTLGRAATSDVVLDTRRASRVHAVVEVEGPKVYITDLHSLNGTLVNGELVDRHLLAHGDAIEIGTVEMRYVALNEVLSEDEAMRLLAGTPAPQPAYQEWDYAATIRDEPQERRRRKG